MRSLQLLPPQQRPKPKARPKAHASNDAKGKAKRKGQDDTAKPDLKGKSKGDSKAKAKPKPDSPKVPCIFWSKGTCIRGSACPFFHDPKAAPKAAAAKNAPSPKGDASGGSASSTAAAKATVATVVASSMSKASASEVRPCSWWATSMSEEFQHMEKSVVKPSRSLFKVLTALLCVTDPMQQIHHGSLALAPGASQGMPAVLTDQRAMISQNDPDGVFEISWIADSGAGLDLASMKALQDLGIPKQSLDKFLQDTRTVRFETGNGYVNSSTSINASGSKFGDASFHVMQSCPLVRSLGQIVESGKPFVWLPGQLPFLVLMLMLFNHQRIPEGCT